MFKVTARTVLELGSELISSDIIAFYELIKNSFDAGTQNGVEIRFEVVLRRNMYLSLRTRASQPGTNFQTVRDAAMEALNADAPPAQLSIARELIQKATSITKFIAALDEVHRLSTITVVDTGSGMSLTDLTENFLVIGTASRKREVDKALARGDQEAPYLGEKGIGRLSAMRLGDTLRVESARKRDSKLNLLEINWADFTALNAMLDDIKIRPHEGSPKRSHEWSGTNIVIGALAEDWTKERVKRMADNDFSRLTDPFEDPKNRPRIVLYWNGERLTVPWMQQELLNHAHARVRGVYEFVKGVPQLRCTVEAIKLNFEHPKEVEEVIVPLPDLESALIGTSREIPDTALTTIGPFQFEMHWYNRQRLTGIEGIGELRTVRELQERWSGVLLFRDKFRVFPYGDDDDDWLGMDRRALRRSGYTLNKTQFIGRVRISRVANPALLDQTNREGLRETPEQQVLLGVMQYVIQDVLFRFMRNVEKQYHSQKIDLADAKTEVDQLQNRAKTALKRLRSLAPKEGQEAVEELQQTLFEFTEFAERARQRIEEVEQESRQMIEMAGVGLMVEVVAHELARASENALENLNTLQGKKVPAEIGARLESLRSQMKSLSKRVRVLDPLSVSGRQRTEVFSLNELIRETLEAHEEQFKRHNIHLKLDLPNSPIRVRAVKGMIVQILENLISNSKYWLEMRTGRESSFSPTIAIALHDNPPTIIFEDNGRGIALENREKVFKVFFSLKEKSRRRGLGLFIARECAEHSGGTLILDAQPSKDTGRLHRFILELPNSASVQ